jgi:hypothetical protein
MRGRRHALLRATWACRFRYVYHVVQGGMIEADALGLGMELFLVTSCFGKDASNVAFENWTKDDHPSVSLAG